MCLLSFALRCGRRFEEAPEAAAAVEGLKDGLPLGDKDNDIKEKGVVTLLQGEDETAYYVSVCVCISIDFLPFPFDNFWRCYGQHRHSKEQAVCAGYVSISRHDRHVYVLNCIRRGLVRWRRPVGPAICTERRSNTRSNGPDCLV